MNSTSNQLHSISTQPITNHTTNNSNPNTSSEVRAAQLSKPPQQLTQSINNTVLQPSSHKRLYDDITSNQCQSSTDSGTDDNHASSSSSSVLYTDTMRQRRRRTAELNDKELWRCPNNGCIKVYKRTSTISVNAHKTNCTFRMNVQNISVCIDLYCIKSILD